MSNVFSYNGGSAVAMTGKNCVAIASDFRLGEGMQTIAVTASKIAKLNDKVALGICGFGTDCTTVVERMRYRGNMYQLNENRHMRPAIAASVLSNMLYSRRGAPYFVSPIVAGINEKGEPEVYSFDLIGCITHPKDFVCCGGAEEQMIAACEAYWRPDMDEDECFEATAQALLAGLERAANSSCGGIVYTITPEYTTIRTIKGRLD